MPSRRSLPLRNSSPSPASSRSGLGPHSAKPRRPSVSQKVTTRRWRHEDRPRLVHAGASATKAIKWSPTLIEAVLEELYVDDHFEELLGTAPGDVRASQHPQAIAVALILRHSWHPDDGLHPQAARREGESERCAPWSMGACDDWYVATGPPAPPSPNHCTIVPTTIDAIEHRGGHLRDSGCAPR
jgi:hypothetical protein